MITTKNRVEELMRTLAQIHQWEDPPAAIFVTADGCQDSTAEAVASNYPHIRLIENNPGRGSVASRAHMMEIAETELMLALDDDSYPEQLDCPRQLRLLFQSNPRLAVATFPQRTDEYPTTLDQSDFGPTRLVRSFPNSGACIRVEAYRDLPGFEPLFFHMYEEPDFALQCIAAGWEVRYFPEITIRHHWVARERSELRNHHRHARNELWSTIMRCPFPYVLAFIPYRIFAQARYACSRGISWFIREPAWWIQALPGLCACIKKRNPVSWEGYKKWINLPDP